MGAKCSTNQLLSGTVTAEQLQQAIRADELNPQWNETSMRHLYNFNRYTINSNPTLKAHFVAHVLFIRKNSGVAGHTNLSTKVFTPLNLTHVEWIDAAV